MKAMVLAGIRKTEISGTARPYAAASYRRIAQDYPGRHLRA